MTIQIVSRCFAETQSMTPEQKQWHIKKKKATDLDHKGGPPAEHQPGKRRKEETRQRG